MAKMNLTKCIAATLVVGAAMYMWGFLIVEKTQAKQAQVDQSTDTFKEPAKKAAEEKKDAKAVRLIKDAKERDDRHKAIIDKRLKAAIVEKVKMANKKVTKPKTEGVKGVKKAEETKKVAEEAPVTVVDAKKVGDAKVDDAKVDAVDGVGDAKEATKNSTAANQGEEENTKKTQTRTGEKKDAGATRAMVAAAVALCALMV